MEHFMQGLPLSLRMIEPPLKIRMSTILRRRKRPLPQQEFSSVWKILGLLEEEEWTGSEETHSAFVFLYAVDFTEIGMEGQLTRDAPVRVLAVRPPVSQCPSPLEHDRIGSNLRDYLRSQLAASPLMRHFVLVFKEQPLRIGRKSKTTSLLGRGQYVAIINAATQVNGLTPLEVRLVQEQGGGQLLTAAPSARTVAGYSASMASRISRGADATYHLQYHPSHGLLPGSQLAFTTPQTAQQQQQQQFAPLFGSIRRGTTNNG